MSRQVKEFIMAEIFKKKKNGRIYKHRSNVHIDQQTKITQIFWKLEWMSHKL